MRLEISEVTEDYPTAARAVIVSARETNQRRSLQPHLNVLWAAMSG